MSKENTIVVRRLPDGTLLEVLPDRSTRSLPPDQTDWVALSRMTDEEINEAALADPDSPPMTPERKARMKRVPQVKVMRGALGLIHRI
jgi:hypothetical protein